MKLFQYFLITSLIFICVGCGGGSTTNDTPAADCATGDNDFYAVENATCGDGQLSRVNPDVPCKENVTPDTTLNCPIDFVLGSGGIGYLSTGTGSMYQIDVTNKTASLINDPDVSGFFQNFVAPSGLDLMEDLTQDERDAYCGGNTIDQAILFVADEGTADGGTVWTWCLNTDDLQESLTPIALISITSDTVENPRGVAVIDRNTVIVTAHTTGDTEGVVVAKAIDSTSAAETIATGFSTDIKDLRVDTDGTILVADAGDGTINRIDLTEVTVTVVQADLSGPRDILLPLTGDDYLISEFVGNDVVTSTLTAGIATSVTTGLTLDAPDGLAR